MYQRHVAPACVHQLLQIGVRPMPASAFAPDQHGDVARRERGPGRRQIVVAHPVVLAPTDAGGLEHWVGDQHDPSHRPAAGCLDVGEQLRPPCPAAAAVVAHVGEEVAERHGALEQWGLHLVQHPAAVAGDAHEPRRERRQRLVEGC